MPLEVTAFPRLGGRFESRDEDERARCASYALQLRGAEAATMRCYVDALVDGLGRERPLVALGDVNDEPFCRDYDDSPWSAGVRDRDAGP